MDRHSTAQVTSCCLRETLSAAQTLLSTPLFLALTSQVLFILEESIGLNQDLLLEGTNRIGAW